MNKLLALLCLSILFASCEKEISIDIPQHKPMLVGNCLFEAGKPMLVHVSNSLGSLDNAELTGRDSAEVLVFEDGVLRELLTPVGEGFYASSFIPVPAKKYTLQIADAGFESISSSDLAPDSVAFTASVTDSASFDQNGTPFAEVLIRFNDPANTGDHYQLNITYRDTLNSWGGPMENPLYMESDDPNMEKAGAEQYVMSDASFNGKTCSLRVKINSADYHAGSEVHVRLSVISSAYYSYVKTAFSNRDGRGNPFSEPVIVYSNFENGLGIFAGSSPAVVRIR